MPLQTRKTSFIAIADKKDKFHELFLFFFFFFFFFLGGGGGGGGGGLCPYCVYTIDAH